MIFVLFVSCFSEHSMTLKRVVKKYCQIKAYRIKNHQYCRHKNKKKLQEKKVITREMQCINCNLQSQNTQQWEKNLKRWVLRRAVKVDKSEQWLMWLGKEFQREGSATEKVLLPLVQCLILSGVERRLASEKQRLQEGVWWWSRIVM